jgi:hypothetical protein
VRPRGRAVWSPLSPSFYLLTGSEDVVHASLLRPSLTCDAGLLPDTALRPEACSLKPSWSQFLMNASRGPSAWLLATAPFGAGGV